MRIQYAHIFRQTVMFSKEPLSAGIFLVINCITFKLFCIDIFQCYSEREGEEDVEKAPRRYVVLYWKVFWSHTKE